MPGVSTSGGLVNKARKSTKCKSVSRNKKPQKTPVKTPVKTTALVPQAHGGAIRQGGNPGNRGGGRPPDLIRQRCRESFDKRIPILEQIADDRLKKGSAQPNVRDRILALDVLAKHGFGGDTKIVAAQADTPEGYRFTLVLGERGQP